LKVSKAVLWRRELENRPGTLAAALEPFAKAGVNLQIVMGYSSPKPGGTSAVEVFPVTGPIAEQAAKEAGLKPQEQVPCVIVDGADRSGLAYDIAKAIADAGINLHFAVVQALDNRYHGIFGFGSQADADKSLDLIQSAAQK